MQILWIFAIPGAFLVFLIFMLVRQRKQDKLHREICAKMDEEIKEGFNQLAFLTMLASSGYKTENRIIDHGKDFLVTEDEKGKSTRTFFH